MIAAVSCAPGHRLPQGFAARLAAVAAAGLALRLVYVVVLTPHLVGHGDSRFFHETANLIGDGHGYAEPLALALFGREQATAQHPPLTSLLLGGASALGVDSYVGQRVVMAFVGALTVATVGLLARRLGGGRAGLLAAGLAAVYPTLVATDGAVMSEAPFGLFTAMALVCAFAVADGGGRRWAAALGAAIALASLSRAEGLLLLPLLVIPAARLAPARRGALAALACLCCAALVLPWSARNWIAFDRPVPISTNYGTLLAGANCARTYAGRDIGGWAIGCVPAVRAANEAVAAARLRRRGLDYASEHAERLPSVAGARLLRSFSLLQPFRQADNAEARDPTVEKAGVVFFWLLAPPAVYGALVLRRRRRGLVLLAAPLVVAATVSVFGYGVPRFREPADVAVVALAALALGSLRPAARPAPPAPAR